MDKKGLIDRLLALPVEIAVAEESLISAHISLLSAKVSLQRMEDALLLGVFENEGKVIDGKNESVRSAQIRSHTEKERAELVQAENDYDICKSKLDRLRMELRALQSVADLLREVA